MPSGLGEMLGVSSEMSIRWSLISDVCGTIGLSFSVVLLVVRNWPRIIPGCISSDFRYLEEILASLYIIPIHIHKATKL